MTADIHLLIDGIKGESAHDKHKDEIEVESWTFGVTQPVSFSGSGLSCGKADVSHLTISKSMDKASPNLWMYCAKGKHLDKVVLTQRRSGDGSIELVKFTLKDAMIAGVHKSGANGSGPRETVDIAFTSVEYDYTPQKPDGKADGVVSGKYDFKAHK